MLRYIAIFFFNVRKIALKWQENIAVMSSPYLVAKFVHSVPRSVAVLTGGMYAHSVKWVQDSGEFGGAPS